MVLESGGNKNTFNVDDVGYASAAAAGLDGGTATVTGASVGTKQGFSIIKFHTAGTNNGATIPHGLSNSPDFIGLGKSFKCHSRVENLSFKFR